MDKDILRLVIISLGVFVMLCMVLWSFFKNKKPKRDMKFYNKKDPLGKIDDSLVINTDNDDFDVVPLGVVTDDGLAPNSDFESDPDPIFNNQVQAREKTNYAPVSQEQYVEPEPEPELEIDGFIEDDLDLIKPQEENLNFEVPRIIQIHIFALDYEGFSGKDLLDAFQKTSLTYGSLKIFERLDSQKRVDFAVASMIEPGTFPDKGMESFTCPGIVFFLQPAELDHPLTVFDEFIKTIEIIATRLEGVKLDHKREPLSKETIKQIRTHLARKYPLP
ncbi:MAG: cell division protein [Methylococcaceae bacterium]|nr:cell division protein [Methylococcaceae bacterium]